MINKNEITFELLKKAMECKTAGELIELAKAEGFDVTEKEAEGYLEELEDLELDEESLRAIASGSKTCYAVGGCAWHVS